MSARVKWSVSGDLMELSEGRPKPEPATKRNRWRESAQCRGDFLRDSELTVARSAQCRQVAMSCRLSSLRNDRRAIAQYRKTGTTGFFFIYGQRRHPAGPSIIAVRIREASANSIGVYVGAGRFFPSDQDYKVARIAPIVARDQPLVGSVSAGVNIHW